MDHLSIQKLLRFQHPNIEIIDIQDMELFFHRLMIHLFMHIPQDRPLTCQSIRFALQSKLHNRIWKDSKKALEHKRTTHIIRPRKIYRWMNTCFPHHKIHTKTLLLFTSLFENLCIGIIKDVGNYIKQIGINTLNVQNIKNSLEKNQKHDLFIKEIILLCSAFENKE